MESRSACATKCKCVGSARGHHELYALQYVMKNIKLTASSEKERLAAEQEVVLGRECD